MQQVPAVAAAALLAVLLVLLLYPLACCCCPLQQQLQAPLQAAFEAAALHLLVMVVAVVGAEVLVDTPHQSACIASSTYSPCCKTILQDS
jgi:hypothetical protein